MYRLESENMTNAGGPMGHNDTWLNWTKFFSNIEYAKEYAEKDYKGGKIKWKNDGNGLTSGDLRYVMYNISEVKIEK